MKNPYDVIKSRYITEKSKMLENLSNLKDKGKKRGSFSDRSRYVFYVSSSVNKIEIAKAIEEIYSDKNIKVEKVNTINVKPKPKRARKGRPGKTKNFKKAIVVLKKGCVIE